MPLALGSWWGLVPVALLAATLVARLRDEEAYLARNLPGYEDYRRKLPWRLRAGPLVIRQIRGSGQLIEAWPPGHRGDGS